MIPGTGEYALATDAGLITTTVPGRNRAANVNSPCGETDFLTSLRAAARSCRAVVGLADRVVVRRRPALRHLHGAPQGRAARTEARRTCPGASAG